MKKTALSIITLLLLMACDKNNADAPAPALLEHYPQQWILTIDEAPDKYIFLKTNGANMFRDHVPQSYSLAQLAIDEKCKFNIAQSRSENGQICFTIQLDKDKKYWCNVHNSTNMQEVHMGTTHGGSEINDPGGDGYKFFIHRMPDVNGIKTVTIESVDKPGYYISSASPGFNYAQNQVVLTKENNPGSATKWQCR